MNETHSDHGPFRELLALRLYGELDAAERARLDAHLAACGACTAFARELEAGLGRLTAPPAHDDLPPGWTQRVASAARAEPRRWRALPWAAAAAGFLLGAATMALVARGVGGAPEPGRSTKVAQAPSPERWDGPVPRSTAGPGPLARLASRGG